MTNLTILDDDHHHLIPPTAEIVWDICKYVATRFVTPKPFSNYFHQKLKIALEKGDLFSVVQILNYCGFTDNERKAGFTNALNSLQEDYEANEAISRLLYGIITQGSEGTVFHDHGNFFAENITKKIKNLTFSNIYSSSSEMTESQILMALAESLDAGNANESTKEELNIFDKLWSFAKYIIGQTSHISIEEVRQTLVKKAEEINSPQKPIFYNLFEPITKRLEYIEDKFGYKKLQAFTMAAIATFAIGTLSLDKDFRQNFSEIFSGNKNETVEFITHTYAIETNNIGFSQHGEKDISLKKKEYNEGKNGGLSALTSFLGAFSVAATALQQTFKLDKKKHPNFYHLSEFIGQVDWICDFGVITQSLAQTTVNTIAFGPAAGAATFLSGTILSGLHALSDWKIAGAIGRASNKINQTENKSLFFKKIEQFTKKISKNIDIEELFKKAEPFLKARSTIALSFSLAFFIHGVQVAIGNAVTDFFQKRERTEQIIVNSGTEEIIAENTASNNISNFAALSKKQAAQEWFNELKPLESKEAIEFIKNNLQGDSGKVFADMLANSFATHYGPEVTQEIVKTMLDNDFIENAKILTERRSDHIGEYYDIAFESLNEHGAAELLRGGRDLTGEVETLQQLLNATYEDERLKVDDYLGPLTQNSVHSNIGEFSLDNFSKISEQIKDNQTQLNNFIPQEEALLVTEQQTKLQSRNNISNRNIFTNKLNGSVEFSVERENTKELISVAKELGVKIISFGSTYFAKASDFQAISERIELTAFSQSRAR